MNIYKFICKCGNEFSTDDYFISYANVKETKCPKCGEEVNNLNPGENFTACEDWRDEQ